MLKDIFLLFSVICMLLLLMLRTAATLTTTTTSVLLPLLSFFCLLNAVLQNYTRLCHTFQTFYVLVFWNTFLRTRSIA